jgi:hypothetical protein
MNPSNSVSPPQDRATTFQPVEGGTESHSGTVLLVEAYVVLWVLLLAWIAMLWRKQSVLFERLGELEKTLDHVTKTPEDH